MRRIVIALVTAAGLAALSARASQRPESTSTARVGRLLGATPLQILDLGGHPWLGHPDLGDVRDSLRAFYARRGDQLCWTWAERLSPQTHAWLEALQRLDAYGLPASDVDASQLADTAASLEAGPRSPIRFVEFDVALSASVARALKALHTGRVKPENVDSALIELHAPLPLALTLDTLVARGEPRAWLEAVQPSIRPYWRLVRALGRYRDVAHDSELRLPDRPPRLHPGRPSGTTARLRRVLEIAGDMRARSTPGGAADSLMDARLTAAIGRLQRRHRLPVTGRLDTLTWALATRALDERVDQITRTLEHWRWLPHDLYAPLVLVNVPAFRLDAMERMDQPDDEMLRINVVVGTAYKTQTPVLTAALTSVDFAPGWDVPPTIARAEVRPEALKDSTYLRRNHMDLLRDGAIVRPAPAAIDRIGQGVRVRQQPGPDNPLGRIKFVMPNLYDVYLHDTPAKYLFERRQRDFSHGCIRVGDAPRLARWALRERADWPAARIDSALAGTATLKVRLPRPMLVAIVYATAEADERGRVRFYPDVYGHDRALELLLAGAPRDSVAAERLRGLEARHGSLHAITVAASDSSSR